MRGERLPELMQGVRLRGLGGGWITRVIVTRLIHARRDGAVFCARAELRQAGHQLAPGEGSRRRRLGEPGDLALATRAA